ncbi:MAG: endonuclease YncB(thermonuclease family) [Rickettsiales bacterium]|jgi:endonuclease YncB( thermonuclease family)
MENQILNASQYSKLSADLANLIFATKEKIETFAKNQLVQTYWQIGKRIDLEKMSENANYSQLIINQLSDDLKISKNTLTRSVQFFLTYPNLPINSTLSWSHYRYLITINDEVLRLDLEEKAKFEGWSAGKLGVQLKNINNSGGEISSKKIQRPTKANYLYQAQILDVVDGDTLILNVDLGFNIFKKQRIRLAQIDAPEIKTDAGQNSFRYLRDLAASLGEVVVRTNKVDIFGRFIGDIFYPLTSTSETSGQSKIEIFENGVFLNEKIVQDGMANIF